MAAVPPDPYTGQPDYYKVVEKALEIGYWALPNARQFEYERQSQARAQAQTRKTKLGGIGGGSGSAPARTPPEPDLSTDEGRFAAQVAYLRQLRGEEE
jgi:hypothetical protein